jgi:gliding motility-associated-like protein
MKKRLFFFYLLFININLNAQVNLSEGLIFYIDVSQYDYTVWNIDPEHSGNFVLIDKSTSGPKTADQWGDTLGAYSFGGYNNYHNISTVDTADLKLDTGFSMVARIYVEEFYFDYCQEQIIFQKGWFDTSIGSYSLRISDNAFNYNCSTYSPNNNTAYGIFNGVNSNFPVGPATGQVGAPPYLQTHTWYCVVSTWYKDTAKTFINGTLVNKWYNPGLVGINNKKLYIGGRTGVSPSSFYGKLDDMRIYDRALTDQEVKTLSNLNVKDTLDLNIIKMVDTAICINDSIEIKTNFSSSDSVIWTPSLGLSDSTALEPIASPIATTTYHVTKYGNLTNLLLNPDFEDGYFGFQCGSTYTKPILQGVGSGVFSQFTVIDNPSNWYSDGENISDHTSGNGKMFLSGEGFGWQQAVKVKPNTNYKFSYWIAGWSYEIGYVNYAGGDTIYQNGVIATTINGQTVGPTYYDTLPSGQWDLVTYYWNSGSDSFANIEIYNYASPGMNANTPGDAFDDLFFGEYGVLQDSITIYVNPTPTANAGVNANICDGNTYPLNGSANGGTIFNWLPNNNLNNNTILNPIANISANTTYSLIVSNNLGCKDTDEVILTILPAPSVSAGPDLIFCTNTNGILISASGAGNAAWNPINSLSNPSILTPFAFPTSITNYTLTVTNAQGCSASDIVKITPAVATNVYVSNNISICLGDSSTLIASGTNTYAWYPNSYSISNQNSNLVFPISNTTYSVVGSNTINNCKDTATVSITIIPLPIYNLIGDNIICIGDTTTIMATQINTYQWYPSEFVINQNDPFVSLIPTTNTIFTVSATDANNCNSIKTLQIIVDQPPYLSIKKSNDIQCGTNQAQLTVSGGLSYIWLPSNTLNNASIFNPLASPVASTTYTVLANSIACSTLDSITLNVFNNDDIGTVIPNAFSPNGDGINDCFLPISKANFIDYNLKIINRWGNVVFESTDSKQCWDGQQKNGQIDLGTYYYILLAETQCSTIKRTGDLLLIK